ncbi:MAG: hypothetical protein ACO20H_00190 [Bacteriovoracaceae bacterium]
MKGSKLKIILIIFVFVITGFATAYYYAVTKISPEDIRKRALIELQKTFPHAEVSLGKIDFDLGTSINLVVEKLSLKHSTGNLLDLKSFIVKIPIFSLLTGYGSIDFKIERPKLSYKEFKKKNNWQMAMGESKAKSKKDNSELSLAVPAFLAGVKINFDISQTKLDYVLREGKKGELEISKFLIKNLNLKEPTAFEVKSKFSQDKTKLDFLVIGELHLNKLVEKNELFTNILINLNNVQLENLSSPIDQIKAGIKLTQKQKGDLLGEWNLGFGDGTKVSSTFEYKNNNLELKEIKTNILLEDLVGYLNIEGLEKFDIKGSSFSLNGQLKVLKNKRVIPNLTFRMAPEIRFDINNIKGQYGFEGSFKNKKLMFNGKGKVLEGQVKTSLNGDFDIMQLKNGIEGIPPMALNVWLNGINFSRQMIRDLLYKKEVSSNDTKTDNKKTENIKVSQAPILLPKMRLDMFIDKIKVDGYDFSGKLRAITSLKKVVMRDFDFNFSKGRGVIGLVSELSDKGISNQINFKLTDLDLKGLNVFLPEFLSGIEGQFNGIVKGNVSNKNNRLEHDLFVNLKAYNGNIKGLNIKEKLKSVVDNMPILKGKNIKLPEKINGEFKTFKLDGRFRTDKYALNSFSFDGSDRTVSFTGKGQVFPNSVSQIGKVDVDLKDKSGKISTTLIKHAGVDILPLRFKGTQFNLNPDYEYTVSVLAKKALQKKTKLVKSKSEEKLKKVIQDKAGELIKNKDVKKLLKGFFD